MRVDLLGVEADVVGERDQLSISSVASSTRPMRASASASQNEQHRNAPSRAAQAVLSAVAVRAADRARARAAATVDRRGQPSGILGAVAEQDPEQQAGVELLAAGVAGVAAQSLRTSSASR